MRIPYRVKVQKVRKGVRGGFRTGAVLGSLPGEEARELLRRVKANRAGLREVLVADHKDADLEAVRKEGAA